MTKLYTREFKIEAVRLAEVSDKPYSEVAEELGVSQSALYRWRQEYRLDAQQAFPGKGNLKEDDKELAALRKRVRELEMENEILKKATAIFAQPRR